METKVITLYRPNLLKKDIIISFIILFSLLLLSDFAGATSLWSDDGWGQSLYQSNTARKRGDLVTIIVVEDSRATQQTGIDGKQESGVNAGPGLGFLSFIPMVKLETGQGDAASGKVSSQGSLTTKVTAKIVEVLDDGNFLIEGSRTFKLNGEEQKVLLRGVVRGSDITSDNTILSTYIADAEIEYSGKGQLAAKQKPGLITSIFNLLF
jgi:flagellar L-ring protein precursor FlgH